MRSLALSDLDVAMLHHAYVCVAANRESAAANIAEWIADRLGIASARLRYPTFGIDDARALKRLGSYAAGDRQCCIIAVDSITVEAQNALLKLLEEPVAGQHFFLVIPSYDLLLPTLASRMQKIGLEAATESSFDAKEFLKSSHGDRLAILEKLLKKAEENDEGKSGITRTVADAIEAMLANDRELRTPQAMETLAAVRKYMNLQGASHKMLLEYLALGL